MLSHCLRGFFFFISSPNLVFLPSMFSEHGKINFVHLQCLLINDRVCLLPVSSFSPPSNSEAIRHHKLPRNTGRRRFRPCLNLSRLCGFSQPRIFLTGSFMVLSPVLVSVSILWKNQSKLLHSPRLLWSGRLSWVHRIHTVPLAPEHELPDSRSSLCP